MLGDFLFGFILRELFKSTFQLKIHKCGHIGRYIFRLINYREEALVNVLLENYIIFKGYLNQPVYFVEELKHFNYVLLRIFL